MMPVFTEHFGNASSIHWFGQHAKSLIDDARQHLAKLIHAETAEIVFLSGGTEADNLAIRGIAESQKSGGRHIITSQIEHHAVLHTCKDLEKQGYEITWLPVSHDGLVNPEDVRKAIRKDTILISIMHANNEIGTIQPIDEIGKIAAEADVYFHSDGVQSTGKIPVNVKSLGIDLYSMSAHKIHGPKGVGALFVKKGTALKPTMTGEGLVISLDLKGVAVSTGSACSSGSLEPSHVLTAIGKTPDEAHGSLRFSLSTMTALEDIDYVIEVLPGIVDRLRELSPYYKKV